VTAVIFDMDGLLVDSEPLWVRAEIEVFGGVGVVLSEADCAQTKGLRTDDVVAHWHGHRGWTAPSREDVERRLIARVAELLRSEGRAQPGAASAIAAARELTSEIALASSSPRVLIDAALDRLDLRDVFGIVQSAQSEPHGKPHPSIFLTTAKMLGVPPTECIVLEDSLAGVLAAKSARMTCIAVPEAYPDHDPRFVIADRIIGSLEAVTAALLSDVSGRPPRPAR
jgi:mannitol-1-/sugar-/sorbitol-6-/2-deoxyglucose-6-phosphatase